MDTNRYTVPCRFVGQAVWAKIFVNKVIVVAQNQVIAENSRTYERNQMVTPSTIEIDGVEFEFSNESKKINPLETFQDIRFIT